MSIKGVSGLFSGLFNSPEKDAYAYAIRENADTQAMIDRWYASQSIAERNQTRSELPYIALIVICFVITLIFLSGRQSQKQIIKRMERNDPYRPFTTNYGNYVYLDGQYYLAVRDWNGNVIELQPTDEIEVIE